MKRIIRLTESDLTRIVRRIIKEQENPLTKNGYTIMSIDDEKIEDIKPAIESTMRQLGYKDLYSKSDGTILISDGKEVYFIVTPKNWKRGLGPHDINDIFNGYQ